MASGYFILSNRNLKRITSNTSDSDYNNYKFKGVPYKVTLDYNTEEMTGEETLLQTLNKIIIIDSGKYRASDGATYAERVLNFPARLNFETKNGNDTFVFVSEKFFTIENNTMYANQIQARFTPIPSYEQETEDTYIMHGVEWRVNLRFEKEEVTE